MVVRLGFRLLWMASVLALALALVLVLVLRRRMRRKLGAKEVDSMHIVVCLMVLGGGGGGMQRELHGYRCQSIECEPRD